MTANGGSRSVPAPGLEPGTESGPSENELFPFVAGAGDRTGDCNLTDQDPQKLLSPCDTQLH